MAPSPLASFLPSWPTDLRRLSLSLLLSLSQLCTRVSAEGANERGRERERDVMMPHILLAYDLISAHVFVKNGKKCPVR